MKKQKILFVCLGNICRSPMAEAIFKQKLSQRNLQDHFEVDSCGTSNYHIGENPDERTVENANENGVPMNHNARQLRNSDLEYYDLILAMDKSNLSNILKVENGMKYRSKVKLMREFDELESGAEVPDPYFGGKRGFQEVFDILQRSCEKLLDEIMKS